MKPVLTALLALGGLAAGWLLPSPRSPLFAPPPESRAATRDPDHVRQARKQELLASLLDEDELAIHKHSSATSLAALAAAIRQSGRLTDDDVNRILATDPAAAMDYLLDGAAVDLVGRLALEWARREPQAAIQYLLGKTSYRAEACLCQALIGAYTSNPRLAADTIRQQSRRWQLRNLETLFSLSFAAPASGSGPPVINSDPFASPSEFPAAWFGADFLDCLADDELRDQARACWKRDDSPVGPAPPEPAAPPDLSNLGPADWSDSNKLAKLLKNHPEETIAALADQADYMVRALAVEWVLAAPVADESNQQRCKRLEDLMDRLGVIPGWRPRSFGPGTEAAAWISRQPLALQRTWAADFTETWAEAEPELAINWARTLPPGAAGEVAAQRGLIVWAHAKPLKAAAYVEALPPGDLREAALSNTAAAWACSDRPGAAAWLDKLPDSPGKERAMERLK
ncbi:MAG: hypothetical protein NTW21_31405 [Verrucomicrobia bacterium]|nr:hypothetical protein [Verrucomicrobiota bacterium]